jgi:hypothetical protein
MSGFAALADDTLCLIGDFCDCPWHGLTTINKRMWGLLGLRHVRAFDGAQLHRLAGRVVHLELWSINAARAAGREMWSTNATRDNPNQAAV